jgi:hypothetical protein
MDAEKVWSLETLEVHLSNKISSLEKYFTDLKNERESRNKERFEFIDKRIDAGNEIRAAMIDQQKNLADRGQVDIKFDALKDQFQETFRLFEKRIDAIENDRLLNTGKTQGIGFISSVILQIIATLASVSVIAGLFFMSHR